MYLSSSAMDNATILSAWLASGGSITCIITQVICMAVSILIYIPFVMAANKQKMASE